MRMKMKGSMRKQLKWEKSTERIIFILSVSKEGGKKQNNGMELIFNTIIQEYI